MSWFRWATDAGESQFLRWMQMRGDSLLHSGPALIEGICELETHTRSARLPSRRARPVHASRFQAKPGSSNSDWGKGHTFHSRFWPFLRS
eukprot:scaffold261_cov336-Pavlova_lutheri.AAC.48